jgi:hypothetical protein
MEEGGQEREVSKEREGRIEKMREDRRGRRAEKGEGGEEWEKGEGVTLFIMRRMSPWAAPSARSQLKLFCQSRGRNERGNMMREQGR